MNALQAWQARVVAIAEQQQICDYVTDSIDDVLINKIVRASYFSEGPRLIPSLLNEHGIHFVIVPHLPRTYLDGAAFLTPAGQPVVGMTLRHDRLDNFWFTLMHELAHIRLHLVDNDASFFDDTEHEPCDDDDPREQEANRFARNALIPDEMWQEVSPSLITASSASEIRALAEQFEISPAIIAGRVRWESGNYRRHSNLVGNNKVRQHFTM